MPSLQNILRDKSPALRRKAVAVIERMQLSDARTASSLAPCLLDQDEDVRSQAALVLARRQTVPMEALSQLRRMVLDDDGPARLAAACSSFGQLQLRGLVRRGLLGRLVGRTSFE